MSQHRAVAFPSIVVQGLSHRFSTRDGLLTVLDGLDLEVAATARAS
ncbi:MAG: hypothetical protein M3507_05495 [Actinomycetota bacterium]|nr:hypothetical protein [Actinomycetota bacterium]